MDEKKPDVVDLIDAAIHAAGTAPYGGHVNQERLLDLLREARSVAIAASEAAAVRKNVEHLFKMFRDLEDRVNALSDEDEGSIEPSIDDLELRVKVAQFALLKAKAARFAA